MRQRQRPGSTARPLPGSGLDSFPRISSMRLFRCSGSCSAGGLWTRSNASFDRGYFGFDAALPFGSRLASVDPLELP